MVVLFKEQFAPDLEIGWKPPEQENAFIAPRL
jgi:hypothetical protein